jgi:putative nucleotidyltransferase with HDIG domain
MNSVVAPPAVQEAAAATTVAHLFRHSLRLGQTHPLLHLLRRHRGDNSPLACAPAAGTAPPAPRLSVDASTLGQRLRTLPALPEAVQRALQAIGDEHVSIDECAAHIERDQGIAASTLKLANSAFFGVAGRIATVRSAVDVLGMRSVTMILTSAALASRFGAVRCAGFEFGAFWRHAIAAGVAARAIAQRCGIDPALAFIGGLLHDVGRLALAVQCPAELGAALTWARAADVQLDTAEERVLGIDHARLGAELAALWKFPAGVVEGIAGHHAPPDSPRVTLADVVHAADAIAHALARPDDERESVPALESSSWMRLRLSSEQALAVLAEVETGVDDICRLFGGATSA